MPVDYSKWDALELSDDSDIEVHPNVDKKSFIRAKQHQIHQERQHRKLQIETLKYERIINDGLLKRISALVASLKAHTSEAATRQPAEIAFQAMMESAGDAKDDQPPPPPEGVHSEEKEQPTYSKMMAMLLDQVNKALDEKRPTDRYSAMVGEIEEHEQKVRKLQSDLMAKLGDLEQEDKKKITSQDIHTGFDSSRISKSKQSGANKQTTQVELLNPGASQSKPDSSPSTLDRNEAEAGDEAEASADAKTFAQIKADDYSSSLQFLSQHPHILTERDTDGLLVMSFDAALESDDAKSQQYVHQALLLQYCRALGKDGVALFFKRVMTKGHKARDVFYKDVQETSARIRNRSREILSERAQGQEGVEQIQLQAIDAGTEIHIRAPAADSSDPEEQKARQIFDGFDAEMRKAIEKGDLDEVNKVLGQMPVAEAEEMVNLFGEANVLSVVERIYDATTDEGKKEIEALKAQAASEMEHEKQEAGKGLDLTRGDVSEGAE